MRTRSTQRQATFLIASVLLGCGSGSSSPSSPPGGPTEVRTRIEGAVFVDGPQPNTDVSAFVLSDGARGDKIVSSRTDAAGRFSMDLGPIDGDVLVDADGITAWIPSLSLSETRKLIQITPVTHLIAGYAARLLPVRPSSWDAYLEAKDRIEEHFGGVEHWRMEPLDVEAERAEQPTDAAVAGILDYSFSEYARILRMSAEEPSSGDVVTTKSIVQAFGEDIADGLFDGQDAHGSRLVVGGHALDGQSLRAAYANAIEAYLASDRHQLAFDPVVFEPLIGEIRTRRSVIFPPDTEGPEIARFEIVGGDGMPRSDGRPLTGPVVFEVEVKDDGEIAALELVIEGSEGPPVIQRRFGQSSAAFEVDTAIYVDGAYTASLIAEDVDENRAEEFLTFSIDHTPPTLTIVPPEVTSASPIVLEGTVRDAGGVDRLEITISSTKTIEIFNPEPTFSVPVDIECGIPQLTVVEAFDRAGNVSEPPVLVSLSCDATLPSVRLLPSSFLREEEFESNLDARGQVLIDETKASSVTIDEDTVFPVRVVKFYNRLEAHGSSPASANLASVRFVVEDDGPVVPEVAARFLIDGGLAGGPVALEGPPYEVALSVDNFGTDLVLSEPEAMKTIEVTVTDHLGREVNRRFDFTVALLAPPLVLSECARTAGSLDWDQLDAVYTSASDTPIAHATVRYDLNPMPEDPVLGRGVALSFPYHWAQTTMSEARREKFAPPSWAQHVDETPPDYFGCHWSRPFGSAYSVVCAQSFAFHHEIENPRPTALVSGLWPEDATVWTYAADGPLNDFELGHVTRTVLSIANQGLLSPNAQGALDLLPGTRGDATLSLVKPRLFVYGVPYAFPTTPPGLPAGFGSPLSGRYYLPETFGADGGEVNGLSCRGETGDCGYVGFGCTDPILCSYEDRDVSARGYLSALEVRASRFEVAAHPVGLPQVQVDVLRTPDCEQPFDIEVRP